VLNVVLDHAEGLAIDGTILAMSDALRRCDPPPPPFQGRWKREAGSGDLGAGWRRSE
jgi:hypothetical protein